MTVSIRLEKDDHRVTFSRRRDRRIAYFERRQHNTEILTAVVNDLKESKQ